jgi:hypothetical protein
MAELRERLTNAVQQGAHDASLIAEAIAALESQSPKAEDSLAAVQYLDTLDNEDGRHDQTIVDALAHLLEHEAAFSHEATYLDATRLLAEAALRHQQWTIASNALLVLASRLASDQVPAWVRAFRTKLFFRLDPVSAFADPEATLELLGPLNTLDPQGIAVVREYLALARDRFRLPEAGAARTRFVECAASVIESLHPAIDDLWQQLTGTQVPHETDDDAEAADEDTAMEDVAPTLPRRPSGPPASKRSLAPTAGAIGTPLPPQPPVPAVEPATPEQRPDLWAASDAEANAQAIPTGTPVRSPLNPGSTAPPETADREELKAQLEALRLENVTLASQRDAAVAASTAFVQTTEPLAAVTGDEFSLGRRHLLVLGGVRPTQAVLQGIAKQFGITKEQLAFETDYGKLTTFDLETLRYSHQCAGVLIGAIPHKMRNVGAATSAIELLRNGEGFPPSVPMYAGSELKGTKTSFRQALIELRDQMRASMASTVGTVRDEDSLRA